MGNQTSSGRHRSQSVSSNASASASVTNGASEPRPQTTLDALGPDGGFLIPMSGVYANVKQEWDKQVVYKLIFERRLAPFYRGLQEEWQGLANLNEDVLETEDDDQREAQFQARLKELNDLLDQVGVMPDAECEGDHARVGMRQKEPEAHKQAEVEFYFNETIECPICMMNYPHNMNTSRCCDQPICTECLVQIKRATPDVNHLDPEPVACPFCVEPNFGVFYKAPALMNRRDPSGHFVVNDNGNGTTSNISLRSSFSRSSSFGQGTSGSPGSRSGSEPRRKSMSATAAEVVTIDHIYPNWNDKVEAVKAAVARRANRRIVFRQVGNRLIPVGVASSSDMAAMLERQLEQQQQSSNGGASPMGSLFGSSSGTSSPSRRERRRHRGSSNARDGELHAFGSVGQDLEDLMINEAIRLSLLDAEEQAKKQQQTSTQSSPQPQAIGSSSSAASSSAPSSSCTPLSTSVPQVELPPTSTASIELNQALHESLPGILSTSPSHSSTRGSRSGSQSSVTFAPSTTTQSTFTPAPSQPRTLHTPTLDSLPPPLIPVPISQATHSSQATYPSSLRQSSHVLDTPASEVSELDMTTAGYAPLPDDD